ncbi:Alpha/beta hydrolase family-domain-containing protein [Paraphoma chrysanthemicola]|uniref:Alpha/beta hydrolase family-domain-containing protein n=1 Tax=Paraphoma chrysanthemicola TaxID=798071 RepID=A0A8K0RBY4_9PLEO|nr:Alpha/beta hydrolase family-domain-containing protein [Paraphoma chrysanthemicola]
MANLPTLLFIPGAWHKPTCFHKVIDILQHRYHLKCVTVTLSSTKGNPEATFKDDLDAARAVLTNETSAGRDVLLIAHSYGGMIGNSAIKGFTRTYGAKEDTSTATSTSTSSSIQQISRHHPPSTGHVIGLVLITSGFTLTGLAMMDLFFGIPPPFMRKNTATGFSELVTPPRKAFYHDLTADEAEEAIAQLTPQSSKALFEGGEYAYSGWKDVPLWYIGATEDGSFPVVAQRINVGMARSMGANVEHRELRTSHSPFLSQPEEVVKILVDAVEVFTGRSTGVMASNDALKEDIIVPATNLWKPRSWLTYGLPLMFGHVLGRCVNIVGWTRSLFRRICEISYPR